MTTFFFLFNVNVFQSSCAFWLLYDIYFLVSVYLVSYNADVLKSVMKYVILLFEFCVVSEKRVF